ncbi:MAG: hypothetical protein ABL908_10180, partial [Hyphomicrobium sp.]
MNEPALPITSLAHDFHAVTFSGAERVIARVRSLAEPTASGFIRPTAFQSAPWLAAIGRALARDGGGADMFAIEVSDRATGAFAALLPLVVAREGRPRVARFADIGVTDYRAPILGAA